MKGKLFGAIQEGIKIDIVHAFGVLQGKWGIIVRPSKFMTVDPMEKIMRSFIILHNMCVEKREALTIKVEEEKEFSEILVRGGVPAIWCGLLCLHESSDVQLVPECLAALYETRAFMADEREHMRTSKLLMNHLSEKHSGE